MSEMKEIHTYLEKTLKKLEKKIEHLPPEIISQAEAFADNLEYEDLLELSSLQENYKKDTFRDPARKAHITNLALFFTAKKRFKNGEIKNTIDALFIYFFNLAKSTRISPRYGGLEKKKQNDPRQGQINYTKPIEQLEKKSANYSTNTNPPMDGRTVQLRLKKSLNTRENFIITT